MNDVGSSTDGSIIKRKLEEPIPTPMEETIHCLESGTVPTVVVKGPCKGATLELTEMV